MKTQPVNNSKLKLDIDFKNLFGNKDSSDFEKLLEQYQRLTSTQLVSLRLQYLSIESILLDSFNYVSPIKENIKTSSPKFATIIRESCNLFEHISKLLYNHIFEPKRNINIFNYLSLHQYIDLQSPMYISPILDNLSIDIPDVLKPFKEISKWDFKLKEKAIIPEWWSAYNDIKHSSNSTLEQATLHNAIRACGAAYVILTKFADNNFLSDTIILPELHEGGIMKRLIPNEGSKLFFIQELVLSFK